VVPTGPLPFAAAPPATAAALKAALGPTVRVADVEVRPGELRLCLDVGGTATVARLTARDGRPAFAVARQFAVGHEDPTVGAEQATALRQLAEAADDPAVAEHLWAALRGDAPPQEADVAAESRGECGEFDLECCDGARIQPPRKLGISGALVRNAGTFGAFAALRAGASAVAALTHKAAFGTVRAADGRTVLQLMSACRGCAHRHACAACFEPTGPSSPAPSALPADVVVEGAALVTHRGRVDLARRLQRLGPSTRVAVVGRAPTLLLGPSDGTPWQPAAADPAAVARSLRGTRLRLVDYRLPGRHGADPWTLLFTADPDAAVPALPSHLTILANRKCVTVCRYCNLPLRLRDNMDLREVCAALQEAAVAGIEHVELFGGEITLRQDLFAVLSYGNALGLNLYVTTTGVGLTDDTVRKLAAADICDLAVSLDSADPAVHDELKHREGMHAAAVSTLRRLKAAGAPWLGINTVVTRLNVRGLPQLLALAAELGVGGVTLFLCQPVAEIGTVTGLLDETEVTALLTEILPACHAVARAHGIVLAVRPAIDEQPEPVEATLRRVARGEYNALFGTGGSCDVARRLVCVQPGGDVRLCNQPIVQFEPDAVVGNLGQQSLADIVASARAAAFRQRAGQFEFCKYCTFDHDHAARERA